MTGKRPKNRYLSYITYMARTHLFPSKPFESILNIKDIESYIHHALLMYGGDGDFPRKGYLDDMWVLAMEQVQESIPGNEFQNVTFGKEAMTVRDTHCKSLLEPNGTSLHTWDWTCGVFADINSRVPCQWHDVIAMAWCQGLYQSFRSPL